MPSRAEVDGLVAALRAISGRAKVDLAMIWSGLDPTDLSAARKALESVWPDLVAAYGDMSAAVAADVFEVWATDLGVEPKVALVDPVDVERANARMRWAIGTDSQIGSLTVLLDELVKQPARSTMVKSAATSGLGWARVPRGNETCAFCLVLASRGAVYHARRSAGDGRSFHGDCDCAVVVVRDAQDYPSGYSPANLADLYANSVVVGPSGSIDAAATLSEMRRSLGIN
jgi:hypothetical protein